MYNNHLYNESVFGGINLISSEAIKGNIVYNGFVLDKTDSVYATNTDFFNTPTIKADTFDIPNSNGIGLNDYKYRERVLRVEWTIRWDDKVDLLEKIDTMKRFLGEPQQTLQVIFNGDPRRATAYVDRLEFDQNHYNIDWIKYRVEFIIEDPFWERVWQITNTFENITSTFQEDEINRWTTYTYPIITISFSNASNVDNISLTMGDSGVEIQSNISINDIVRIDSINKDVLVNGDAVEFDWVFPRLNVGNNPYTITVSGTYEYNLNIQHNLRFI